MELYVNGNKTDVTLEDEKTVGEVLSSFQRYCEEENLATVHIIINGNDIDADKFDSITALPLEDNTRIELTVISQKEIVTEFKSLKDIFKNLNEKIKQIPSELQNGNDKTAGKTITLLANTLDQYCHLTALAALFPETFKKYKIGDKSVQDFFADFSSILEDFEQGLKNNDTVMVSDLSEYEVSPRIENIILSLEGMNG